jgi:phage baseplate assembly protein gpV
MSAALYESVARIARHEASARATAGVGTVVDLFEAGGPQKDHAVTVEMRDSGLVLPRVPIAVGVMGFAAIPAVGDLVLVVFLDGDFNAPVVVGRIYHPEQEPPKHSRDQIVLALPSGADPPDLMLLVKSTEPLMQLTLPGDVKIEIKDGLVAIVVGAMHVRVEGSGGGRAEIAAGGSKITLKQDGDITVKSAAKLTLEGNEVEISGVAKVKVSGAQVEIN